MEKYFVTHPQAVDLKELGFDEPCIAYFNGKYHDYKIDDEDGAIVAHINPNMNIGECLNRPLKSQVFEWGRKYRLSVVIEDYLDDYEVKIVEWTLSDDRITHEFPNRFDSWGDAESAAIDKLIELVKNK